MNENDLPENWIRASLSELGIWAGGGTPSKSEPSFWNGSIPWVSPKDMKTEFISDTEDHITPTAIDQSATRLIPTDSVLVVTRSGILERTLPVATTKTPVTINQDLKALAPREGVRARYVALGLKAFEQRILKECTKSGTTVANVEFASFLLFEMPLAPTGEQDRIIAEVEKQFTRLDAGVETLKRVQVQLKRYRASVLKAACEGRLVTTEAELSRREKRDYEPADKLLARILKERRARWEADQLAKMKAAGKPPKDDKWKAKYVEPEQPDTEMLPPLGEGWSWASLDQLSWTAGYGTSEKCDYDQTGLPVLRIPNISRGKLEPSDLKFAPISLEIDPGSDVSIGDLIIVRTNGSKDLIGRGALVVARPARKYYFASYLIRYRLIANDDLLKYVSAIWHAPYAREWVQSHAATSAGQYNISMGTLARFPVPLPPSAEQRRIAAQVDALLSVGDAADPIIAAAYSRANRLRQALLKLAFEGGLIPQDPNDEHATNLLERISVAATNESCPKQIRTKQPKNTPKKKVTG